METTYNIPRNAIRALSHLMAVSDVRFYMNAILIEIDAEGQGRIVATDGHVLGVIRFESNEPGPVSIIVPSETVKSIKANKTLSFVPFTRPDDVRPWIADFSLAFEPLDVKFPDYVRVIPAEVTGIASHANADLIAKFGKVAKELGAKSGGCAVRIGWNHQTEVREGFNGEKTVVETDGAALVEIMGYPEFIGVLMPLRSDATETPRAAPNWAKTRIVATPAPVTA